MPESIYEYYNFIGSLNTETYKTLYKLCVTGNVSTTLIQKYQVHCEMRLTLVHAMT